jgi:phage N-6-adenine-methyltransferase
MDLNKELMFSSKTDLWSTPQAFFDRYDNLFHFTLDVCASEENAKCPRFFTKEMDGLKQDWQGNICWMNPPYGREIGQWIQKAYEESKKSSTIVVCLLPARTDTKWFHDYCMRGEIEFIKGRLKFGNSPNPAPFPSMVVIFGDVE